MRLIVLCLLLPALLAALDSFFRARRRRLRTGAWFAWALAAGAAVPLAWAWLRVLGISGALQRRAGRWRRPTCGSRRGQAAALASVALAVAAGVLLVRPLTRPARGARGSPSAGAAGAVVGAIVCGVTLAVWLANPYAAALLLPAAHLWLFLGMPQTRLRGRIAWVGARGGLLAPLLGARLRAARAARRPVGAGADCGSSPRRAATSRSGRRSRSARWPAASRRWSGSCSRGAGSRRPRRGAAAHARPGELRRPGSLGGTESALRR